MTEGLDSLFAELPEVLTVQEVADLLRMNKAAIYRWLREGTIPAYYRSRSWFVLRDDLKEWMLRGSNQGGLDTGDQTQDPTGVIETGDNAGADDPTD